jgi:hypothetical protein
MVQQGVIHLLTQIGVIPTWILPSNVINEILLNSGGNLASQMQSYLLRPSNHAPNETQQTRVKLGLSIMQEGLLVIT